MILRLTRRFPARSEDRKCQSGRVLAKLASAMTRRDTIVYFWTVIGVACMGLVSICAQGTQRGPSTSRPYTVPRNALGQPDLEGVWTNNSITPLQRPAGWAGRALLTDAEVAQLEKAASKLEEGGDALFGDESSSTRWRANSNPRRTIRRLALQRLLAAEPRRRQPHVAHRRPGGRQNSPRDSAAQARERRWPSGGVFIPPTAPRAAV